MPTETMIQLKQVMDETQITQENQEIIASYLITEELRQEMIDYILKCKILINNQHIMDRLSIMMWEHNQKKE